MFNNNDNFDSGRSIFKNNLYNEQNFNSNDGQNNFNNYEMNNNLYTQNPMPFNNFTGQALDTPPELDQIKNLNDSPIVNAPTMDVLNPMNIMPENINQFNDKLDAYENGTLNQNPMFLNNINTNSGFEQSNNNLPKFDNNPMPFNNDFQNNNSPLNYDNFNNNVNVDNNLPKFDSNPMQFNNNFQNNNSPLNYDNFNSNVNVNNNLPKFDSNPMQFNNNFQNNNNTLNYDNFNSNVNVNNNEQIPFQIDKDSTEEYKSVLNEENKFNSSNIDFDDKITNDIDNKLEEQKLNNLENTLNSDLPLEDKLSDLESSYKIEDNIKLSEETEEDIKLNDLGLDDAYKEPDSLEIMELDSEKENNIEDESVEKVSVASKIDRLKELISELKNDGTSINLEEFDFEDMIQLIIKIEK